MTKKIARLPPQPGAISLLSQAIQCDNENAARLLVQRAMGAIHSHTAAWKHATWSDEELNTVIALIRGINPQDTVESVLAAQFIALHLQGTANIARENYNTMGHNLQMIRLSHQALEMLQRYRGKSQTINMNYNTVIQAPQGPRQKEG